MRVFSGLFPTEAGPPVYPCVGKHPLLNHLTKCVLGSRNTEGTINYQPRVHKFRIMFKEKPDATIANPSEPNLQLTYLDPVRFTGPDGTPVTGLDPDVSGFLSYPGFPTLPAATYIGDGVGGPGSGGKRISVDSEGLR